MSISRILSISFLLIMLGVSTASASKKVIIDLSTQTATAYENGYPVFSGNVSTGTKKRPTPRGTFRILEKALHHKSSSWPKPNGGAVMNYMQRLTKYGIAMHLGYVPNYPASHGCVRLENGFAQKMFAWSHTGMKVQIVGTPPTRVYRKTRHSRVTKAKKNRRYAKKISKIQAKPKTLDFVSSSPKKIKLVNDSISKKWDYKRRHRTRKPRRDPLKITRDW